MPYSLLIIAQYRSGPSYPWAALSAILRTCVTNEPYTPAAPQWAATPMRCSRRNHRSSRSRDTLPAGVIALPAHGWWCSRTNDLSIRWATGLPPNPGLDGRVAIRNFELLYPHFIVVDHRAFQQAVTHQVQQRLEVFAALDHPMRQGLPEDYGPVPTQHRFEAVQWQIIDVLGGQQHGQHAGAGHALLNQLSGFISGDRRDFAATAVVDLAHVFEHTNLHRHDVELLADFFANDMLAATTGAGQFMLGQVVDDLNT